MDHDSYIARLRADFVSIAQQMVDGDLGVVDAARKLSAFRHELSDGENDSDFMVFDGIDSETDDLPIGSEREFWNTTVLATKGKERETYENSVRESR